MHSRKYSKNNSNAAVSGDKLSFEGITQFYIVFSVMARFFSLLDWILASWALRFVLDKGRIWAENDF